MTGAGGRWGRVLPAAFALSAAAAVAARAAGAPEAVVASASAPVLLAGAALPVLLFWSPVEPNALKLLSLASLLSPPVLAALHGLSGLLPGPFSGRPFGQSASMAAFGVVALANAAALARPARLAPLGRAAWIAVAGALALGGFVAAVTTGLGDALRLESSAALWHAGVAEMIERRGPWENPWLAGTPLPFSPAYALLGSTFAGALGTAHPTAFALVGAWSVASVPVSLYLFAAPLFREPARVLGAAFAGLLAWNAGGALAALGAPDRSAAEGWAAALGGLAPGGPGAVAYGLATFVRPDPAAPALAYAAAGWMAAAHGVRHGARPWVGLAGLLLGLAVLLEPLVGLGALLAAAAAALAAPGASGVRAPFLAVAGAWSLPGLWAVRRFGLVAGPPDGVAVAPGLADVLVPAWPLALATLGLAAGRWRTAGGAGDEAGRRTILVLALAGTVVPAALGVAAERPGASAAAVRLASLALGVLAAGGLVDLAQGGGALRAGPRRLAAAALALSIAAGGVRAAWVAGGAHLALARRDVPAREVGGRLVPESLAGHDEPGEGLLPEKVAATPVQVERARAARRRHLARAYAWLAGDGRRLVAGGPVPVLVRRVGEAEEGPLAPDPATLYADLPLWVDRWRALAGGSLRWEPRHAKIRDLYTAPSAWDPFLMRELAELGRPAFFLVEEVDREATYPRGAWKPFRGVDLRLERLGAERVHVAGTVAVYLWRPPEAGER